MPRSPSNLNSPASRSPGSVRSTTRSPGTRTPRRANSQASKFYLVFIFTKLALSKQIFQLLMILRLHFGSVATPSCRIVHPFTSNLTITVCRQTLPDISWIPVKLILDLLWIMVPQVQSVLFARLILAFQILQSEWDQTSVEIDEWGKLISVQEPLIR